jgi:hypothetical protein
VSDGAITPVVQRLIAEHIVSADQLDILLLLHGAPGKAWTAREVSEAVFTVPTAATLRLEQLVAAGFVTSSGGADPGYAYAPTSAALRSGTDSLAAAYRANRVAVIQLVFQQTPDPLQRFSDSFLLGRRD